MSRRFASRGGVQSCSKTPSAPVSASRTTWPPSETRTLRLGPPFAGLHVLGEDEDLVARRLDDRVDVAGRAPGWSPEGALESVTFTT